MSENSFTFTLSLRPVLSNNAASSDNDWLKNSEENLFQQFSSDEKSAAQENNNSSLENIIDNLPSPEKNKPRYSVNSLDIKSTETGIILITPEGDRPLKSGDFIELNNILYEVKLTLNKIVVPEKQNLVQQNNHAYNPFSSSDIWQDDHSTHQTGATALSPNNHGFSNADSNGVQQPVQSSEELTHSLFQYGNNAAPIDSDPLNFLYQTSQQKNNTEQYLPPYQYSEQSSKLIDGIEKNSNISNNTPIRAQQHSQMSSDQGNILNDLGIDHQRSTIISQPTTAISSASTYSESSPMDMLDNFLDAPELLPIQITTNNALPYMPSTPSSPINTNHQISHSEKPSLLGGLKNVFKKLSTH